jgi:hypothetical protein
VIAVLTCQGSHESRVATCEEFPELVLAETDKLVFFLGYVIEVCVKLVNYSRSFVELGVDFVYTLFQ